MLHVLFIDRANPVFYQSIIGLAQSVRDLDLKIYFLTDRHASRIDGKLEVVNTRDVPQSVTISELERRWGVSLHKVLVPERSFFDYSTFRRCQTYSRMSLVEIERKVLSYLNGLDYLMRERADLVIEGMVDNFLTSAMRYAAIAYGKEFRMAHVYYWWVDGLFFVDRIDQSSSEVDERYAYYRAHPQAIDRARMDEVFRGKRYKPKPGVLPFRMRLQQLMARFRSYEPLSLRHWLCRRAAALVSRNLLRMLLPGEKAPRPGEEFILYPLQISPEASLLGAVPEQADQFSLLKNLSMNLPYGVKLYVKEHPGQQMGYALDYGFYRRLTSLPNVRYLRKETSLSDLIGGENCRGVIIVTGTLGLETAIHYRKPVFLFGPALYGAADCFYKPESFTDFYQQVQAIRRGEFIFDEDALYAELQALDDTVVRANVDMSQAKDWVDTALSNGPIFREFLLRSLRRRATSGRHDLTQSARASTASSAGIGSITTVRDGLNGSPHKLRQKPI
jgi:hypothetical protein